MRQYQNLLKYILKNGKSHADRTGTGTTSVFGYQFRHCLSNGFPLLTTKRVSLRHVAGELFWFLSGDTNARTLQAQNIHIWDDWQDENGDLGPIYSAAWRNFHGVDQIKRVVDMIQRDPNSRRIYCTALDPANIPEVAPTACHSFFQIKCYDEGTLDLHMYMRSCDSFLGLPYNIASYALLLQLLAHVTGYVAHDLIISFGDLHIYNNHQDQVQEQLGRIPRFLPTITINQDLCNGGYNALMVAKWEDIMLVNYGPYPKIKGDISV